jgi:hypothetical protein
MPVIVKWAILPKPAAIPHQGLSSSCTDVAAGLLVTRTGVGTINVRRGAVILRIMITSLARVNPCYLAIKFPGSALALSESKKGKL